MTDDGSQDLTPDEAAEFASVGGVAPPPTAQAAAPSQASAPEPAWTGNATVSPDDIQGAAKAAGIDPDLFSRVVHQESGGNARAVSPKGAVGAAGLMPGTASDLGVNPYDAADNLKGGATYLKTLLDRYNGDQTKAIAAYNAGPEAVDKYGGVPPYPETQNYVARIVGPQPGADQPLTAAEQAEMDSLRGNAAAAADGAGGRVTYDAAANVGVNPDGSVAYIGKPGGAATVLPDGSISVDLTNTSNPDAIAAWLKAHPDYPANHLATLDSGAIAGQPGAAQNANIVARGVGQGVAAVGSTIDNGMAALERTVPGVADFDRYVNPFYQDTTASQQSSADLVTRLRNEGAYGSNPYFQGGQFGGSVAATIPLMMATDGLAGAGAGYLTDAAPGLSGAARFLGGSAGGAGGFAPIAVRGASLAARGALEGGQAGAMTAGGNSTPFLDNVVSGAGTGAVLGPVGYGLGRGLRVAGGVIGDALLPLTDAGRGQIADNVVRGFADGGPTAINADEMVDGSTPTLAQATANPGLAAATRALRDVRPNEFVAQETANNNARNIHLQSVTGTPATIDAALADREATTAPLREASLGQAGRAAVTPAVAAIDETLASPAGQLDPVASALKATRAKIVQPTPDVTPEETADFNRKVSAAIGAPSSPVLDQATMSAAKSANSARYNDVLGRTDVNLDDDFTSRLAQVGSQARELGLDPSQIGAIDRQIANLTDVAQKFNGTIPGQTFKAMTESNSTLSRLSESGGAFGSLASDIRSAMNDALQRSASPEDKALVDQANSYWKKMRTVEGPVLAASRVNPSAPQVTPQSVLGAVTRNYKNYAYTGGDELGDLASSAVDAQGAKTPVVQDDPRQLHAIQMNLGSRIDSLSRQQDDVSQQSAAALEGVRQKLIDTIDNAAPGYRDYTDAYESASAPVKAQGYLQAQRFTDAQGNPTLGAVQNAIRSIETRRALPGPNDAKAISNDQLNGLYVLRDDLLRSANAGLGRSIGSTTFQNLAMNNLFAKGGAPLAGVAAVTAHHPLMAPLAYGARLLYSSQNGPIMDKLVNRFLDPETGGAALSGYGSKPGFFNSEPVRRAVGALNDNFVPASVIARNQYLNNNP